MCGSGRRGRRDDYKFRWAPTSRSGRREVEVVVVRAHARTCDRREGVVGAGAVAGDRVSLPMPMPWSATGW